MSAQLSSLVNEEKVRKSIKRLFTGTVPEILSELFQNSQRAGASKVEMTTSEHDGSLFFEYKDNGHGLKNGVNGLHTLLRIAESDFDSPTIEAQEPMGLGIHSLLASDQITMVSFESNGLGVTLDTRRWWNDPEYYSTWFERVYSAHCAFGLQITVVCTTEFIAGVRTATNPPNWQHNPVLDQLAEYPARGYTGILEMTLDGVTVDTSIPESAFPRLGFVTKSFKDSEIDIGLASGKRNRPFSRRPTGDLVVNWYGQLVHHPMDLHDVGAYVHVTSGRPFNPMAPTRRGLIEDNAFKELVDFIKNEYFKAVFDVSNQVNVPALAVRHCFTIDKDRATKESPYLLAEKLVINTDDGEFAMDRRGTLEKFLYTEAPAVLSDASRTASLLVRIPGQEDTEPEHGISVLADAANIPVFVLAQGEPSRVQQVVAVWEPGEKLTDQYDFYKPGRFGFAPLVGQVPGEVTDWVEFEDDAQIVVLDDPGTDIRDTTFVVGTNNAIEFLSGDTVDLMFDYSPENDNYDCAKEEFDNSVRALIRDLIGDAVQPLFTYNDLSRFVEKGDRVVSLRYNHTTDDSANKLLKSITIRTAKGKKKTLKIV